MAIIVTVHGFIECPGYKMQHIDVKRVHRFNRCVLQQLPESDAEYPFFTKNMFSILPYRHSFDFHVPQFGYNTIHFAADYKDMYALEVMWLQKFENLLSKLCWYHASVHTSWNIRYDFRAIGNEYFNQYNTNPPTPPKKWTLKCYKLVNQEMTIEECLLDGPYVSPYWENSKDSE